MKTSQGATTLPPLLPSSMQSIWQAASLSLCLSPPCCHLARWALISVGSDTPRKIYTTSTRTDGRLAEMERYKRHTRERGERKRPRKRYSCDLHPPSPINVVGDAAKCPCCLLNDVIRPPDGRSCCVTSSPTKWQGGATESALKCHPDGKSLKLSLLCVQKSL